MTSTARIVFDINERESVEIPFEYANSNHNGKTKRTAQKVKGSRSKFYYLDIKEFERKVRADERKRIQRHKKERVFNFIQMTKALIKYTWQKLVGATIIVNAVYTIYNSYVVNEIMSFFDWSVALLTIPVGLYIFFTKQFFFKKNA